MKLGILITTDKHISVITGLVKAAVSKAHEVMLFSMDEGSRLLGESEYVALSKLERVDMSFCQHNADGLGIPTSDLPDKIRSGSQYDNAVMNSASDKMIVLYTVPSGPFGPYGESKCPKGDSFDQQYAVKYLYYMVAHDLLCLSCNKRTG